MIREEEENAEPTNELTGAHGRTTMLKDKFYTTYILFYGFGVTTLIPGNFYTTATDYWMYKFRDTDMDINNTYSNNENRTGVQAEFVSDYSIVSNVSNVFFLVLTITLLKRLSMACRIVTGLCGVIIMFNITCVFVEINTDPWQRGFFVATMIVGFFISGFTAIAMVTLFEMLPRFPPIYLATVLSGQAICGIFAALVKIFSLSIDANFKTTALIYFSIGMFFVFLTLVGYLVSLKKSKFFRHHLRIEAEKTVRPKLTREIFCSVLSKVKYYLLSMILVLGSSVLVYPAVTSLVVSVDEGNGNKWNDVFFVPVISFLLYHLFDYIGRELAAFFKKPANGLAIFITSFLRIAFVPMVMLCNAQPRSHLSIVFDEDYFYMIFIILFAFSHGYLINLCVIQIPMVTPKEEKDLAMILILVFMLVSVGACSFLSAVIVKAL